MKQKDEILKQIRTTIDFLKSAKEEREEALNNLLYGFKVSRVEDLEDGKAYSLGFELERQIEELNDCIESAERESRYIFRFDEV